MLSELASTEQGLKNPEAEARLAAVGANLVGHAPGSRAAREFLDRANNPLHLLLIALAGVFSYRALGFAPLPAPPTRCKMWFVRFSYLRSASLLA